MPSITIRVADDMRVAGYIDRVEYSKSAKTRLVEALERHIREPLAVPVSPMASVNASIWMSAPACADLEDWGGKFGLSVGEAASAMLIVDFQQWQAEKATSEMSSNKEDQTSLVRRFVEAGLQPRAEQIALSRSFAKLDGGTDRRVLVAEAGTGTGKTLAYLSYALDCLDDNPTSRIYIALPTFALMAQIRSEIARLTLKGHSHRLIYLMGQSEWVSEVALNELLQQAQAGNLPMTAETQGQLHALMTKWERKTSASQDAPPWSVADLEQIIPDFAWQSDVTLRNADSTDTDDGGAGAYRKQFTDMHDAQIIVLTHAMLAHLLRMRYFQALKQTNGDEAFAQVREAWKETPKDERERALYAELNDLMLETADETTKVKLPDADLLIVDEAHALRDAIDQAFETSVSVSKTAWEARELVKAHPDVFHPDSASGLQRMLDVLKRAPGSEDIVSLEDRPHLLAEMAEALRLATQPKKNAGKKAAAAALKTRAAQNLRRLAQKVEAYSKLALGKKAKAFLHWSPRREFPRLSLGSQSLSRECNFLWSNFATRSLLVSGTLYESMPQLTCDRMRFRMAIPGEYLREMEPVHAPWQISPVTVCMVAESQDLDGRQRYCRPVTRPDDAPGKSKEKERESWINDVSDYIVRVQCTAPGGVLVLGTAFADLHDVAERIKAVAPDAALLVHQSGIPLSGLREQFMEMTAQGLKPTMLASGGAWTGFDLHDTDYPNALTDLVILNMPFGLRGQNIRQLMNQISGVGYLDLASEALLLTRQAVGRLVRSPDTPHNRRIHFLDARLHWSAWRGMTAPIRRFLARYEQRVVT